MKHLLLLIIVTTVYFSSLHAQDSIPHTLNLSDCIQLAVKNNLDVQRSSIQTESAHINLLQSKENILPVLNASIIHGVNEGRNIDPYTNTYVNQQADFANQELTGSLLLFNGLAMQSLIRQSSFAFAASKAKEQQMKDNISLNVVLVYLQVLSNMDILSQSIAQRETTKKQLERLEELNKKGAIVPATYYDLKGQLMNDELQVATNRNTLQTSKINLFQLLNIPYEKNSVIQRIETDPPVLDDKLNPTLLYNMAEQNLAMIKAADLNVRVAGMQMRRARSGYYPSLYLRAGVLSNYSSTALDMQNQRIGYMDQFRNNFGKYANVSLVVPIFNNLCTRNNVSQAKLNQKEMRLTAETTRNQLQQLTEQAYLNMITAQDRCDLLKEQVNAFTESFKSADVRFNLGAINSTDYLISKNNLEKSKINLIISGYDFILRKKIVDYYKGEGL